MLPLTVVVTLLTGISLCIRYDSEQVLWNLNQNQTATDVMDYWGQWENHSKGDILSSCDYADPY